MAALDIALYRCYECRIVMDSTDANLKWKLVHNVLVLVSDEAKYTQLCVVICCHFPRKIRHMLQKSDLRTLMQPRE